MFILLCSVITFPNIIIAETKDVKSILSWSDNRSSNLKIAWEKIDEHTKQKIERYLVIELGLSSTGHIELIGDYKLTDDNGFGKEGQRILHFIQRDLFGSRLFWSCLINVKNNNTKILYHLNIDTSKKPIGNFKQE